MVKLANGSKNVQQLANLGYSLKYQRKSRNIHGNFRAKPNLPAKKAQQLADLDLCLNFTENPKIAMADLGWQI